MNTQNTTEQKTPEEIKNKNVKTWIIAFIVVITSFVVYKGCTAKYDDEPRYVPISTASETPAHSTTSTTAASKSATSKSTTSKAPNVIEEQRKKAQTMKDKLESSGYTVFENGYTKDQCIAAARSFLKSNYNTDFYDTSVVVAMSKNSVSAYVITGCKKSGDPFTMGIAHVNQKWIVTECKWN